MKNNLLQNIGVALAIFALLSPTSYAISDAIPTAGVTIDSQFNDEESFGGLDLLIPLAPSGYTGDTLFFLHPGTSATSRSQQDSSLGLGLRHLFGPVLAGANVYGDYAESANDSQRYGLGFGAELLTEWVGLRANYYAPESDRDIIDRRKFTSSSRQVSESTATSAPYWGELFGSVNSVFQRRMVNRITTTRTTDIFTSQQFNRYEVAMEGYDVRGEVNLPIGDSQVYGGYRSYDNPFGGSEAGAFGGVEFGIFRGISVNVEYNENDYFTGGEWNAGLQASAYFGHGHGLKDMFAKPVKRSLREELYSDVKRARRMQFAQSGFMEDVAKRKFSTKTTESRSVLPIQIGKVLIEDQLVVVDPSAPKNNNFAQGTFENAYNTIQEAADVVAGLNGANNNEPTMWKAYVQANNPTFTEDITVTDGNAIFKSSSELIFGNDGKFFGTPNKNAVVSGGFDIDGTNLNNLVAIRGFTIQDGLGGGGQGILTRNVNNLIIERNIVENTTGLNGMEIVADLDAVVFNSTVNENIVRNIGDNANTFSGVVFTVVNESNMAINAANNTFENILTDPNLLGGAALKVNTLNEATVTEANLLDNTFINNTRAIALTSNSDGAGSILVATVDNNTFLGGGFEGIRSETRNDSNQTLTIQNNFFDGAHTQFAISVESVFGGVVNPSTIQNNTILGSNGIQAFANDGTLNVTISGNTLDSSLNIFSKGIVASGNNPNEGALTATIENNQITGGQVGIEVAAAGFIANHDVNVLGNTISDTQDNGFKAQVSMGGAGVLDLEFANNSIDSSGSNGAYFETASGGDINVLINGNTITNSVSDAIEFNELAALSDITVSSTINNTTSGSGSGLAINIPGMFPTGTIDINGINDYNLNIGNLNE